MRKLLAAAATILCALPSAAAEPPSLLKPPVAVAPLQEWAAGFTISLEGVSAASIHPVNLALTVSTEGTVSGCAIERSSGSAVLDQQTCSLFTQKGRFQPALDASGRPVTGVFRVLAAWGVRGQNAPEIPLVDMVVEVQKMPQGLGDPAYVDLAVSVDEAGKVDRCVVAQSLTWAGERVAGRMQAGNVLGETACAQAVAQLRLVPARNSDGQAVRSVQTAIALFTAQAAALASKMARPDEERVVVTGKVQAKIPYKGSDPIQDFEPLGREVILLQAKSGQWYRAELVSPCIGSSALIKLIPDGSLIEIEPNLIDVLPREIRSALERQTGVEKRLPPGLYMQEGLAFPTHADGTFDRNSVIIASVLDPFDVVQVRRCRMSSLTESDPPTKRNRRSRR